MPKLKNTKHELFSRALIKNKGSQTKSYKEVYACADSTAECNSSKLINLPEVQNRVLELLDKQENTKLSGLLGELNNQVLSTKELFIRGRKVEIKDNTSRLDAIKQCLKLYGLDRDSNNNVTNNNINILMSPEVLTRLEMVANSLKSLHLQGITDAEVIDKDYVL